MARDIEHVVRYMRRIVEKSQGMMKKNLAAAMMGLPPRNQIQELKEVAYEMCRIHNAVMRLAAARDSAGVGRKKTVRIKKMWKNVDLSRFWEEVIEKAQPEIEAYRRARAKSMEKAASTVFI